jgi:hypothetical protein
MTLSEEQIRRALVDYVRRFHNKDVIAINFHAQGSHADLRRDVYDVRATLDTRFPAMQDEERQQEAVQWTRDSNAK